jgi:small conductance mechanosensitive channel
MRQRLPLRCSACRFTRFLPSAEPNGIVQQGIYVTAPVVLDGITLFRIAAPVNASVTQLPIESRVAQVEAALAQLLVEDGSGTRAKPIFDYRSIRVHTRPVGDAIVLEAVDGKHPAPLPIVTVTSVDARANSTDVEALAAEWQAALQSALVRALVLRQPAVEKASFVSVVRLAAALLALTLIVVLLMGNLRGRMAKLETEIAARDAAAESQSALAPQQAGATEQRRRFFALQLRALKPTQRVNLFRAVAETLVWGLALSWLIAAVWSLSLFAATTPLAQAITHGALGVAATLVLAALVNRVVDLLIARTADVWHFRSLSSSEDRARSLLRVPTIARTVAGAKSFVVVFVAALSVLGQIGVPIGSVVTIGGLAAIALSLAAQNFVRDFLNGFLVLLEDQYVVGDYVTINTYSGIVERLTLRMVQIRDAAGDLVTIPHSSVINVVNQSRNWSRVDYFVPVDPQADIAKAIEIVRAQIASLASEDDWMDNLREPLEWIGIDGLSKDGVIVRASVRTAPLRQFELRRQINKRVLAAFEAAGIALGALPVSPWSTR